MRKNNKRLRNIVVISTICACSISITPQALAEDNNDIIQETASEIPELVNFKPISIQARNDVGSNRLVEYQEKQKELLEFNNKNIPRDTENKDKEEVLNVSDDKIADTPTGTEKDLSFRVKEALKRANSLYEKREKENSEIEKRNSNNRLNINTNSDGEILPPDLSGEDTNSSSNSSLKDIVQGLSSKKGSSLKDLNLPHDDSLASKVVDSALSRIGIPYVWGGESMAEGGYDCSGLMQYAYGEHGISLSRTTYTQVNEGTSVGSLSEAKPGDLIFYSDSVSPHHVAMYIGDGQVVHAPYTGAVITTAPATMMKIGAIRRII